MMLKRLFLIAWFLLVPAYSWAVDSHVQATSAVAFTAASVGATWGSNTTSGNTLACYVWWNDITTTVTGVSDSVAGALADSGLGSQALNSAHTAQMFYLGNITGGTTPTVTASFSASPGTSSIGCHEISGRATASVLDQKQWNTQNFTGTGTDFVTSGSVTTTTDGQYIFGATHGQFSVDVTAGTNYTLRTNTTNHSLTENLTADQVSAGSIAATFTPAGNEGWITGIMTFKASGGGGGGSSIHMLPLMGVGR